MVREGRVLISVATDPDFGSGYTVTAYEIGAQVASGSSGTTATVRAGHGFAANDKFIVFSSGTYVANSYNVVTAVTSTTLTITAAPLSAGDLLVNLGQDTGTSTPSYVQSVAGLTVYADMAYGSTAENNTVTCDSTGRYRYYHKGTARWELVRTGTTPIALYTDTGAASAATINVKDFGAQGDGVADDTVAIQAALTSVPSTGGKVYVPAGTYIESAALWVKSNTHFYGDGIDVTIIKRKANSLSATVNPNYNRNKIVTTGSAVDTPYTNAASGTSITVTDMTLDGNNTNQSLSSIANGADGLSAAQTLGSDSGGCIDGVTIQRVKVQNVMQDGIALVNCRNALIDSCVTYKTGQTAIVTTKNGISLYGGPTDLGNGWCKNAVVSNNRVSYSGDATFRAAEGIVNSIWDDVTVTGNDISHVEYGIEFTYTTSGSYTNKGWTIADNTIHDLTDSGYVGIGITVNRTTAQAARGISITGNTIWNTNCNGINVGDSGGLGTTGLVISGNVLYSTNLVSDGTNFNAIDVVICKDVVCSNNTVSLISSPVGTYGIRFYGVTQGVMSGNLVSNDNGSATVSNFILNVGTQNCLVVGNRSVGNKYGIWIHSTGTNSGNTLFGNYVTGALTSSIFDDSGQTNYSYGSVDAGAFTVPGTATITGATTTTGGITGGIPRNVGTWSTNTATAGTDSACTNGVIYCASIFVPANMTVTGIQYLVGSVGGTDKVIVSLHDVNGVLVANSATAGATVGTAAQTAQVAFTSSYGAKGPAWYFIGLTFNGTTAKFRTIPNHTTAGSGVIAFNRAETFGTPQNFTPLTNFTPDIGPVAALY